MTLFRPLYQPPEVKLLIGRDQKHFLNGTIDDVSTNVGQCGVKVSMFSDGNSCSRIMKVTSKKKSQLEEH